MSHPNHAKKPLARVLAVEDHPDIGALIKALLKRYRIEPTVITTGEEALKCLATETFDLILLDINLPGMSGLDMCRHLKADPRLKEIPVIFVSAQGGGEYKAEAKRLGAVDFIEKPFDLMEFISCVTGHLKLGASGQRDMRRAWPLPKP